MEAVAIKGNMILFNSQLTKGYHFPELLELCKDYVRGSFSIMLPE